MSRCKNNDSHEIQTYICTIQTNKQDAQDIEKKNTLIIR